MKFNYCFLSLSLLCAPSAHAMQQTPEQSLQHLLKTKFNSRQAFYMDNKADTELYYQWHKQNLLTLCASRGSVEGFEEGLKAGALITYVHPDGFTTLMAAARGGNPRIVQLAIEAGINVNAISIYYETALMLAARSAHTEIVNKLLQAGADARLFYNTIIEQKPRPEIAEALKAKNPRGVSINKLED